MKIKIRAQTAVAATVIISLWWIPSARCDEQKPQKPEAKVLDKSEEMVNARLDSFRKSGVPTPKIVDAAFAKAKNASSVENWLAAASAANAYGRLVEMLYKNYSDSYYGVQKKALDYERVRNTYYTYRNTAYLEVAKLYLANGDKATALSYATTAVELSGSLHNAPAENLVRQIMEYVELAPEK